MPPSLFFLGSILSAPHTISSCCTASSCSLLVPHPWHPIQCCSMSIPILLHSFLIQCPSDHSPFPSLLLPHTMADFRALPFTCTHFALLADTPFPSLPSLPMLLPSLHLLYLTAAFYMSNYLSYSNPNTNLDFTLRYTRAAHPMLSPVKLDASAT